MSKLPLSEILSFESTLSRFRSDCLKSRCDSELDGRRESVCEEVDETDNGDVSIGPGAFSSIRELPRINSITVVILSLYVLNGLGISS